MRLTRRGLPITILLLLSCLVAACGVQTTTTTQGTVLPVSAATPVTSTAVTNTAVTLTHTATATLVSTMLPGSGDKATYEAKQSNEAATLTALPPETYIAPPPPTGAPRTPVLGMHECGGSGKHFLSSSCWNGIVNGDLVVVGAGGIHEDRSAGFLEIMTTTITYSTSSKTQPYYTPIKAGSISIASVVGTKMTLQSSNNTIFAFDLVTRTWVTPDPCDAYPLAINSTALQGVKMEDVLSLTLGDKADSNVVWLSWTGDQGNGTLAQSLSTPGDSSTYSNPSVLSDHTLAVGKSVSGRPGVNNSQDVRAALDKLIGNHFMILVPVWDQVTGHGRNTSYHISGFAWVYLNKYDLASKQFSFTYYGPATCNP